MPPDNAGDIYSEQLTDLQNYYGERVTPGVRRAAVVPEAYSNGIPLPLYGHRARAVSDDYTNILNYVRKLGCLL